MRTLQTIAAALLLLAATAAHGQTYTFQECETKPEETVRKVVYVVPSENKTIKLQDNDNADNLDGYIRWAIKKGDNDSWGTDGLTASCTMTTLGYVWWYNNNNNNKPNSIEVNVSADDLTSGVTVICDASSVQPKVTGSGKNQTIQPRCHSIRFEYTLKNASESYQALNSKKTEFDDLRLSLTGNNASIKDLIETGDNIGDYVPFTTDIYAPNCYPVNYRLPDRLNNYYVSNNQVAQTTRWLCFDENGSAVTAGNDDKTDDDIFQSRLGVNDKPGTGTEHTRYLLAQVAQNGKQQTWYTVALLKVHLVPYAEHLTENDLHGTDSKYRNDDNYADRYMEEQVRQGKYKQIASYTFEHAPSDTIAVANVTAQNNINESRLDYVESYYAFAVPLDYQYRKDNRLSVGRGEYALYRTLGMDKVSVSKASNPPSYYIPSENTTAGHYNDYWGHTDNDVTYHYNVYAVDRLWEKTNGKQSGYFLYMDATDDPGVVMDIPIETLCPNTTLVFSAWVCDFSHEGKDNPADPAALSFTLKSKDGKGSAATTLAKFYTGAVTKKPSNKPKELQQAQWQQVTFKFAFTNENFSDGKEYFLEIANNAKSSNGADYAIDEICIYRSLPDIDVERLGVCNASPLYTTMRHQTTLRNMGWTEGQDLLDELYTEGFWNEIGHRIYRYGLLDEEHKVEDSYTTEANIFLLFLPETTSGTLEEKDWITINKKAEYAENLAAQKRIRIIATSSLDSDNFPKTEEEATRMQQTLNVRAMLDYNYDIKQSQLTNYPTVGAAHTEIDISSFVEMENGSPKLTDGHVTIIDPEKYEEAVALLWNRLQIAPLRIPWVGADGDIHLTAIEIENTDLKYMGQPVYEDDGKGNMVINGSETGRYRVMLLTGVQALSEAVNPDDPCALVSGFTVYPTTTIRVETEAESNVAICTGALRKVTATLNAYNELMEPVPLEADSYIFDWYLCDSTEYNKLTKDGISVKSAVQGIREYLAEENKDDLAPITPEMVTEWMQSTATDNALQAKGQLLKQLLEAGLLKSATKPDEAFNLIINSKQVVAMPYVKNAPAEKNVLYCTDKTAVDIPMSQNDMPVIHPGMTGVEYPFTDEVPLRLGQRHMDGRITLTLPVQTGEGKLHMAENATRLGLAPGDAPAVFLDGDDMPAVGTVTTLSIAKEATEADISIRLADTARKYLHEGRAYDLLIPFAQYGKAEDGEGDEMLLSGECDGLISLPVKVVPEYLTWKGGAGAVWYDDTKWQQSTEAELYMGGKQDGKDANGDDEVTDAFAPLYFTKITLAPGEEGGTGELALTDVPVGENGILDLAQEADADPSASHIQYELAVDTVREAANATDPAYKIVPYYIHKVSEVYFKPGATLVNQHLLVYDTARVEFALTKSTPYWMASPLKAVYAGDMYAPYANGKQETPAFDPITFDGGENGTNHRWKLPFYQKAWDKAVAYSNVENPYDGNPSDAAVSDVAAVQSNWSIEYNDVWVPDSLGKGFYMRVEEKDATVRLPKADKEYLYQSKPEGPATRSGLSPRPADRNGAGRLADGEEITVDLNTRVDGDGDHFLVGNPYMAYLSMEEFFNVNAPDEKPVLNKKYWTMEGGTTKAVVGTPDIGWTGNETEDGTGSGTITGFIPPMTAFFVERAGYTEKEQATETDDEPTGPSPLQVKFTTAMMAAKATATETSRDTRSISATAPVLTLTAERDGKAGRSVITLRDKADNAYRPQEDAVVLLDSELDAPVAYSVAGNRAAQVNALRSIDNIPVGVYNNRKGDVSLTIGGISQLAGPLYLYDAHTRKSTLLEGDSYTLNLSGESHGRYYLRSSAAGSIDTDAIAIYSVKNGKVIVSSTGEVRNIKVYSLGGALVKNYMDLNTAQYTFNLPKGIYIVRAEGKTDAGKTEKVMVR